MRDRLAISAELRRRALAAGVPDVVASEVAICVAELLANTVRHAGGTGRLVARAIAGAARRLEVEVQDSGPGLGAPEQARLAMEDGWSRGRFREIGEPAREGEGLGIGLGAVRRLLSDVRVQAVDGGGCRVSGRRRF